MAWERGGGCQVDFTNRKIRPDSLSQSKISFTGPHRRVRLDHRASSRHIASSSQLIIGCSRGGVMNDEGGGGRKSIDRHRNSNCMVFGLLNRYLKVLES